MAPRPVGELQQLLNNLVDLLLVHQVETFFNREQHPIVGRGWRLLTARSSAHDDFWMCSCLTISLPDIPGLPSIMASVFTALASLLTVLTLSNACLSCSASVDDRTNIEPVPGASSTVNMIGSNFARTSA
jgi:hypothetical protein